jgi:hypothetical protein
MEIEDIALSQPVVKRESGGNNRPVRLVRRQGTEGSAVLKKERDIADIPDVNIVDYSVRVIEMEAVLEMIGVRCNDGQKQYQPGKYQYSAVTHALQSPGQRLMFDYYSKWHWRVQPAG